MIKRTLIIALIIIIFLFAGAALVAFLSLLRLNKEMIMINTATESLLQRQRLHEFIIRFEKETPSIESLSSGVKELEAILGECMECHRGSADKDAIFLIQRLSVFNERLSDITQKSVINEYEVRIIFDKMDDLTAEALVNGRNFMSERIERGIYVIRRMGILTFSVTLAGGGLIFAVFLLVNRSLKKNIFSVIKASVDIAEGKNVDEINFGEDFLPVKDAFMRLQSQLKEKEEEIKTIANRAAQAEKLTALGELVAGVSHELNNPLQVIVGYSEMAMSEDSLPENYKILLSRIYESAIRASKIVRNLREFARQREPLKEYIDLRQIVDKVIELLEYEFSSSGIIVNRNYSNIPLINADPDQIKQVVLNLLKNAQDAIMETGKGEGKIDISIKSKDHSVVLEISDTGNGIPDEHINRIFEPFFTTKPVGKGTGLGLSITYGIITAHNGNISVKSRKGEGTTFTIELPAIGEK
ncbi:MAG: ATP-binding protein [Thermodesulfovibrionales bacterium]|nr:ATP-binding protein [Thermodesulfovibrionales bacterium]